MTVSILILAGVFLPAFIALRRQHKHTAPIVVINAVMLFMMFAIVALNGTKSPGTASLLGLTMILAFPFWVGTLVWSVWPQNHPILDEYRPIRDEYQPPRVHEIDTMRRP
jgi:peptidoglycan/LPS O-acetylase OafA/YrhL